MYILLLILKVYNKISNIYDYRHLPYQKKNRPGAVTNRLPDEQRDPRRECTYR